MGFFFLFQEEFCLFAELRINNIDLEFQNPVVLVIRQCSALLLAQTLKPRHTVEQKQKKGKCHFPSTLQHS